MWNKNWKVKQNLAKLIMSESSSKYYTITQEQCWFIRPDNSRIKTIEWGGSMNSDIYWGGFLTSGLYTNGILILNSVDYNGSDIGKDCRTTSTGVAFGWLLHVGSGTDTPTENDFNLKSAYSYGVDVKQIEAHTSTAYDETTRVARKTINSVMFAHKDMTINEIGLSAGLTVSSRERIRILFAREILATPLNVTQGQTFQVSLTFEQTLDDIVDVPSVVSADVQALNDEPEVLNDETAVLSDGSEALNDETEVLNDETEMLNDETELL